MHMSLQTSNAMPYVKMGHAVAVSEYFVTTVWNIS